MFGAVEFTTRLELYGMPPEEPAILQKLYENRLVLESLESQPVAPKATPASTTVADMW